MAVVALSPIPVQLNSPLFHALAAWPFDDEFVSRMLATDIPQRVKYGNAQVWAYLDPQRDIVGFGTLDICDDCSQYADGKLHTYVPLLAVNPALRGCGHGRSILTHLVERAACKVAEIDVLHPALFLDVYEHSTAALGLYTKSHFVTLNGPIIDPANGKPFLIMAKRVAR